MGSTPRRSARRRRRCSKRFVRSGSCERSQRRSNIAAGDGDVGARVTVEVRHRNARRLLERQRHFDRRSGWIGRGKNARAAEQVQRCVAWEVACRACEGLEDGNVITIVAIDVSDGDAADRSRDHRQETRRVAAAGVIRQRLFLANEALIVRATLSRRSTRTAGRSRRPIQPRQR